MTQLSIIVGLGNPEDKYERTLHNAGFWFVDALARKYGGQFRYEKRFDADFCRISVAGEDIWLVKPQSYMNHSGQPVRAVLECAGIHDVLSKSLGSSNPINIVHATVEALRMLERPEQVAARRGLPLEDVAPAALLRAGTRAGADETAQPSAVTA